MYLVLLKDRFLITLLKRAITGRPFPLTQVTLRAQIILLLQLKGISGYQIAKFEFKVMVH